VLYPAPRSSDKGGEHEQAAGFEFVLERNNTRRRQNERLTGGETATEKQRWELEGNRGRLDKYHGGVL
jgi:hypothetical protein